MDAVFLSDLHLRSLEERNGQILLRFLVSLERSQKPPPMIFLLGDIFDLWVSGHRIFIDRYRPLLESLRRLKDRGSRIIYFEGNHDLHLAPCWEQEVGAEIYVIPGVFQINGLRVRCEHGDEINREDLSYLRLRAFLRSSVMESVAHKLPGGWLDSLGNRWSRHSRKRSSAERVEREERIREMLHRHAIAMWEEDPYDAIISGHMHVKDDWVFERGNRQIRSFNLGSWFEGQQVLTLDGKSWIWQTVSEGVS